MSDPIVECIEYIGQQPQELSDAALTELAELRRRIALHEVFVAAWDQNARYQFGSKVEAARAALTWLPEGITPPHEWQVDPFREVGGE